MAGFQGVENREVKGGTKKSQKSVCLHHQKSQKGAKTTMKRKIYQQLLEWKNKRQELHFVFVDKMHEKIW